MAFVKSNKTQAELLVSYLRGKGRGITAPQAKTRIARIKKLEPSSVSRKI
jgi:hypothetical protein